MKRIGALALSLVLLLACVVPVGASYEWHGQSFLDDYYGVPSDSPIDIPASFLPDDSLSVASAPVPYAASDGKLYLGSVDSFSFQNAVLQLMASNGYSLAAPQVSLSPVMDTPGDYSVSAVASGSISLTQAMASLVSPWMALSNFDTAYYQFNFVLPSPVSSLELTGLLSSTFTVSLDGGAFCQECYATKCGVVIGDAIVDVPMSASSGVFDFNNFVYDSVSGPIDSFSLRFWGSGVGQTYDYNYKYSKSSGSVSYSVSFDVSGESFYVSVAGDGETGSAVDLDKFNEQNGAAQDFMGAYDDIENQWTDNMMSNWDSLNIDNFSFDDGLVSGFALFTGIFNDIFSAFGVYALFFFFPLILGIVLLVIGRVSRSKGGGG